MRTCILISICIAALGAASTSYSQVTQDWVQTYNGPGNGIDVAFSITVDNAGNVYITGNSPGQTSANDITTIKYNSAPLLRTEQPEFGMSCDELSQSVLKKRSATP
jgi:Beta-propeller repeat.